MVSKRREPRSLQKRLWRLGYARSSFDHVYNTCDYILQTPISVESPMYYPLVAAIYTLYAQPFSRSQIIGRWTKQVVPKKHLDLHEQMMLVRNQLVAHSDATTSVLVSDMSGNHVRFIRTRDHLELENFQVDTSLPVIIRTRELALALISRIDEHMRQIERRWLADRRISPWWWRPSAKPRTER